MATLLRGRLGVLLVLHAAAWLAAPDAQAQTCDEFKATLAERIDATGARGYSLETAPAGSPVPPGARVIGNCDSGATVVFYRRWAAARAASGAAEPASAAPARAAASTEPRTAASATAAAGRRPEKAERSERAAKTERASGSVAREDVTARSVDAAVAQLAQIPLAFDLPAEMNLGEAAQVRLAPGSEQALRALERALGGGGSGETQIATARRLEAQLSGANFRITALTPKDMTLASAGRTPWRWQLQPTLAGTQSLQASLSAEFFVDGAAAERAVRTIDTTVLVKIPLAQRASAFVQTHWHWLLAFLIVPVAGAVWAWRTHHSAYDAAGLPRGPRL